MPTAGSARAEALLAYLVLHRDVAQSRRRLAALLWPDSAEPQARTNLRHLLHTLRGLLPGPDRFLEITPQTVRWRPDADVVVDLDTVDRLLATGRDDPQARRAALTETARLADGDLLDGCDDDWLTGERDRLRRRHLDAVAELAELCAAQGDHGEGIGWAERLLRADPLREDGHLLLMRLHAARGDRAAAVRAFHRCTAILERELAVEPSAATRRVYQELVAAGGRQGAPRAAGPPLVGRTAERARLVAAWRATDVDGARCVLVTGEAGIGKSRLVEEFGAWCARDGAVHAAARCYPAEGPLAYGPVVDWLRHPALRAALRGLDRARLTELARLLPELLDDVADLPSPLPLPEGEQRQRLFEAVTAAVLPPGRPVLLVVDDVPHADSDTCRLLHYLLRARPAARLLVVATARPEDLDQAHAAQDLLTGLRGRDRLTEIALDQLRLAEAATLVEHVTGSLPADAVARRLHRETGGNPLFLVEALRAGGAVRAQVQSVIEARLARLGGPAREVLGVAATLGREFGVDVLAAAAGLDEDTLADGLDELWRRRIVREHGLGDRHATYDFAHDRIREVAYRGLGPARRRRLHGRVAAALEHVHRDAPAPVSAQIAAHHEQAGDVGRAVDWYGRAAAAAQLLHAHARAVQLLGRALDLLGTLPPSPARDRTELDLRVTMLAPLVPLHGYTSPEMIDVQRRAGELVSGLGVEPSPPLLRSLALDALTRADFAAATEQGRLLLAAGERRGEDVLVVEGAYVLGIAAFWQADLAAARRHFELAVRRYRPDDRVAHLTHYGQDPKAVCLGRLACTLWFLGLPDDARRAHAEALAWSAEIGDPFTRMVALTFGALLAVELGDDREVRRLAAELVALGTDGMNSFVVAGFAGYVTVLDGDVRAGLDAIRSSVRDAAEQPVAPGQHAMMQRLLLAAHLAVGDAPAARAVADRLLAMDGPARLWAPLARRVRTDLAHA
ncbi:MAG TPA: AAA family ATPase [Pseudonocardia sp.]|nr:AAA family ATPase [Pseudonocardia sp.]